MEMEYYHFEAALLALSSYALRNPYLLIEDKIEDFITVYLKTERIEATIEHFCPGDPVQLTKHLAPRPQSAVQQQQPPQPEQEKQKQKPKLDS